MSGTHKLIEAQSYLVKATVPIDTTDSNIVDIHGGTVVGVIFPATMTGTGVSFKSKFSETAANLGGTLAPLHDSSGNLVSITKANSACCGVSPLVTESLGRFVQIVSQASEAVERIFYLVVRTLK